MAERRVSVEVEVNARNKAGPAMKEAAKDIERAQAAATGATAGGSSGGGGAGGGGCARDGAGRRRRRGGLVGILPGDRRGVLLPVALLDRGLVLVPVGEPGAVLGAHESQAHPEQLADVPDVAGVLHR